MVDVGPPKCGFSSRLAGLHYHSLQSLPQKEGSTEKMHDFIVSCFNAWLPSASGSLGLQPVPQLGWTLEDLDLCVCGRSES